MVESLQLPTSSKYENYSFPETIWSPSEHEDCHGGKARLPHHLLGTCLQRRKHAPYSLQLAYSRHEFLLGKLKQTAKEGALEHQQG